MKLIILTTAITRGDFHKRSIGKFYELYFDVLKKYTIYHIINLDNPSKLKNIYSKKQSIELFNTIIPNNVNKIIIHNNNPGFLNAYKNVVTKANTIINSNSNIKDKYLIWWFEDDWEIINFNKNLFDLILLFPFDKPFAFNSVQNSPLGSFRGGPIMNTLYFKKYFDIVSNNIANNTCDPEKQVNRWLSGINKNNGKKSIHRNILNDKIINIIFLYFHTDKNNINEIPDWYYNNVNKFNKNIIFKYHVIKIMNITDYLYGIVDIKNKTVNYINKSINDINTILNNDGINYVCIKPYIFSDIGREFNIKHSLKKWSTINDGTSYQ